MTRCASCGTTTDKPTFEDGRSVCLRCRVVEKLVDTQAKMTVTGIMMVSLGGDAAEHGHQMLGAARIIDSWMDGIDEMQRKGAE